jgi:Ser/Thr protein kinase RdoA (MazF antagonist)
MKPYKINLKQEECIMITDKKLECVLAHWNLKEPVEIKDLYYESSGNKSENTWIVNGDYIIKVGTNILGLKQHIALSRSLAASGLETAVSVPTRDGCDYLEDGQLYFCLMNRIEGECIKSGEIYNGDYKANARYLGEIIGQLHLVLQNKDKEMICNEPNLYETIRDWAIPEVKKHMIISNNFYEEYLTKFKEFYVCLPKHIIHRDPNPSNIIMKDGRLVGFIDFELSERNVRIFDPCYAATAILSESFDENDYNKLQRWFDIFSNIIAGYDSVCKLTDEEKQAIPYVIYSIQMMSIAYFGSMNKYEDISKVNQKILMWLINNRDELMI